MEGIGGIFLQVVSELQKTIIKTLQKVGNDTCAPSACPSVPAHRGNSLPDRPMLKFGILPAQHGCL